MDWALIIANIALVVVTWLYTRHTKKMADIMYKDYELRITPHYELKCEIDEENNERVVGRALITNTGSVPIYIKNAIYIAEELKNKLVKNPILLDETRMEILKSGDTKTYNLIADVNRIASSPPGSGVTFFGASCRLFFSIEIAGPNQNFKKESQYIK